MLVILVIVGYPANNQDNQLAEGGPGGTPGGSAEEGHLCGGFSRGNTLEPLGRAHATLTQTESECEEVASMLSNFEKTLFLPLNNNCQKKSDRKFGGLGFYS